MLPMRKIIIHLFILKNLLTICIGASVGHPNTRHLEVEDNALKLSTVLPNKTLVLVSLLKMDTAIYFIGLRRILYFLCFQILKSWYSCSLGTLYQLTLLGDIDLIMTLIAILMHHRLWVRNWRLGERHIQ